MTNRKKEYLQALFLSSFISIVASLLSISFSLLCYVNVMFARREINRKKIAWKE